MSLYESINNSLLDTEVVRKIICFYTEIDATDEKKQKSELYSKIVTQEDTSFDSEKYKEDFNDLLNFAYSKLYNNLKLRCENKYDTFSFNIDVLKKIFEECDTYDKFQSKVSSVKDSELKNDLRQMKFLLSGRKEAGTIEEALSYKSAKQTISEEEIKELAPYIVLDDMIRSKFQNRKDYVMGFHINSDKTYEVDETNEPDEIKFYVNAGDNTCKVATLFAEKCEQRNLKYYFKVADPNRGEEDRSDKMCIYSALKNASTFYSILQEIKQENPDIIFKDAPILTGKIVDGIGIASDFKQEGKINGTYNNVVSYICIDALNKVFKGIDKKEIKNLIEQQPEFVESVKKELQSRMVNLGRAKDKLSIKKSDRSILKKSKMAGERDNSNESTPSLISMQNVKNSIKKSKISISEINITIRKIRDKIKNKLFGRDEGMDK